MRSPIPEPPPSRTEAVSPPGNRRERAKSPVLDAIAGAARALSPVSFLLKPRVGRAPEFPEEDEDEDEFPQQTEYQSFASVGDGRARMFDGSFLSATTAAGDTTDGGNSSMADASRSVAERSNYSFEEEERLMREIEEKKRKAAERDAKGKAVEAGQRGTGGWFTNLGGLSEPQQVQSRSRRDVEQEDHEEEEEEIDVDEQPAHGDLDPDQVVKSTTRRRPRVSHDDKAFAYQPGDSASESESDGDGGRRSKTRRRRSGKIGPLGAEGMKPVMEGKRRKGRKGGRGKGRESSGLGTQDEGEDENEVDVNETFDAQLHQQTLDDADASFVVHLRREQQRQRRQASHPPTPVSSSSSHLPTHYKTVLGPLGFVQHHLSRILRSALVALIFLFNTTLAVARWSMEQPSQILDGLVTSLQSVEARKVWTVLGSAVLLGTLASLIDPRSTPTSHPPSPVHLYSSSSSAWNPFRSRSDSSTTPFRTPDLPPDSMDELLSRLSSLESALGSLSSQASNSADTVSRSDARLDGIDARLSSELRRLSSSSAQQAHEEKERMQSLDRVVGRIREDVDTLNGRVKSMATKVDDNSESVVKLDTIFEGVRSAVKSLSERVKDAERTAKETSDATRIARIATDAVENYLPSRLVVKMNPKTKQLELDPAFWTALRSVFTEHGQVGSVVSSEINKLKATLSIQSTPSSSASSATTIVRESTPSSPPTWSDFLASNEAALQAWSRAELDQQAQAGAVVSRATFLEMLHRELETLKADVSKQLDVNARQLSDEFSRDRLETRTNNGSPRPDITQPVLADLPESRVTSLLQGLIDSALLRYSKDTLARTDFALYTAGGRVIPSITSDTYEIETPSSFFSRLTGKRAILGRPPVTALHPDTNLGNCWPFAGAKGQLGILLARPTIVNAITIEHAAREISLDMAAAPREIQGTLSFVFFFFVVASCCSSPSRLHLHLLIILAIMFASDLHSVHDHQFGALSKLLPIEPKSPLTKPPPSRRLPPVTRKMSIPLLTMKPRHFPIFLPPRLCRPTTSSLARSRTTSINQTTCRRSKSLKPFAISPSLRASLSFRSTPTLERTTPVSTELVLPRIIVPVLTISWSISDVNFGN